MSEFKDFGKTPRFRASFCRVSEKIDGTNAQIYITENPEEPVLAGSRNRWVKVGDDNFGFAAWVHANAEALRRLGPGRHFGEWYGAGIGRRYGMTTKRFALFNAHGRWDKGLPDGLPPEVHLVPELYRGPIDSAKISEVTEALYTGGSVAVPGFDKPEGVVITCGELRWKITDNGDQHKGCTTNHADVVRAAAAQERKENA